MIRSVFKSRAGRVISIAVAVVVVMGIFLWNIPLMGQWRVDRPVTGFLLESPVSEGPWQRQEDRDPGAPYMRGLDERQERSFVRDASDPSKGKVNQTVMRFGSPTWAWLVFRSGGLKSRYSRYGQVEPISVSGSRSADDQEYACLLSEGAECQKWGMWLRYGQYLVEVVGVEESSVDGAAESMRQLAGKVDLEMRD
ncbi:hypothetical protein [Kitasatospora sp. NPDC005748]|uniref:hypothetical protein n=1 Tax=Kitasatospora sp. NPDC005748 TaxID=3157063 RepID=UPI0033FE0B67